jgi:hypothetical protein
MAKENARMKNLNVADLISAIKQEILKAEANADKERKIFQLDEMELELRFVVAKDTSMNAELKVLSFGGGGKADYRNEEIQSIKLKFKVLQKRPGKSGASGSGAGMMLAGSFLHKQLGGRVLKPGHGVGPMRPGHSGQGKGVGLRGK